MGKSPSTVTTNSTSTPNPSALAAYQDVVGKAQGVAATPYTPYTGELTAGLNGGQTQAIGQLQGLYGSATPYMNTASGYLGNAASGLGAVQPYLQLGSQAAAAGQNYASQAAGLLDPSANSKYLNPYQQQVIDATMATVRQNDQIQQAGLTSNAVGSGAYGGDRAGVASAVLSGQQQMADNATVANLNAQNYAQANAARLADAGVYGNLANSASQSAQLYGTLGQLQGQTAQAYGSLGQTTAGLGTAAQNALIQGASAGLQGSTLQQQTQQAQDQSAYQQFQAAQSYPFTTTGWLSNIVQGIGSASGGTSSTTSPGPSTLSQIAGAGTAGLGILNATGAFGSNGWLSGLASAASGGFAEGGRVGYAGGGDVVDLQQGPDGVYLAPDHPIALALNTARQVNGGSAAPGKGFVDQQAERLFDALRGQGSALSAATSPRGAAPRYALGGLVPRPMFDDGGLTTDPNALMAPSAGLVGGNVSPIHSGGGMGLPKAPAPYQASQQSGGLGVLSGSPQGGSGGSGGGLVPSNDHAGPSNASMALISAGLGMMAGTSPFAMTNIGAGGLQGLREYDALNQRDRDNALAQSELGIKQGDAALRQRQQGIEEYSLASKLAGMSAEADTLAGKNSNISLADRTNAILNQLRNGGLGGATSSGASSQGSDPAQDSAPSASFNSSGAPGGLVPSGGPASPTASAPAGGLVPTGGGNAPSTASSAPPASASLPAAATAPASASSNASSFWSNVNPQSNPNYLNAQADRATAAAAVALQSGNGDGANALFQRAQAYRQQAQGIIDKGTVMMSDGSVQPIPGFNEAAAAKEAATTAAQADARSRYTLRDIQPDPTGPTYTVPESQILSGQGVGAGSPPGSAIAKQPASFEEAQKKIASDEVEMGQQYQTRQLSLQRLQDLQGLMQKFQTGAYAEQKADLVAAARAAGLDVPDSATANPAAFQQFLKDATANVFNDVKGMGGKVLVSEIQGLTKANANPELQPEANAAIIGQGIGAIRYEDAHYNDYMKWRQANPYATTAQIANQFEIPWQRANPVKSYVDAARNDVTAKGIPLPTKRPVHSVRDEDLAHRWASYDTAKSEYDAVRDQPVNRSAGYRRVAERIPDAAYADDLGGFRANPGDQLRPNMTPEAAEALAKAKAQHVIVSAYRQGEVGKALKTNGYAGQYVTAPEGVARAAIRDYSSTKTFLDKTNRAPGAVAQIGDLVTNDLRRRVDATGSLTEGALASWKQQNAGAIRALREVDPTFGDGFGKAAEANSTLVRLGQERDATLKAFETDAAARAKDAFTSGRQSMRDANTSDTAATRKAIADRQAADRQAGAQAKDQRDTGIAQSKAGMKAGLAQADAMVKEARSTPGAGLVGKTDPSEVQHFMGRLVENKGNGPTQARAFMNSIKDDPAAIAGARKALVDHIVDRIETTATTSKGDKAMSGAAFKKYLSDNRPALQAILPEKQLNVWSAVAHDIERRDAAAAAARVSNSATATRLLPAIKAAAEKHAHGSVLGGATLLLGEHLLEHLMSGNILHAAGAAGAAAAGYAVKQAVTKGLGREQTIRAAALRDALLNPERARFYIEKAGDGKSGATKAVLNSLRRELTAAQVVRQEKGPQQASGYARGGSVSPGLPPDIAKILAGLPLHALAGA